MKSRTQIYFIFTSLLILTAAPMVHAGDMNNKDKNAAKPMPTEQPNVPPAGKENPAQNPNDVNNVGILGGILKEVAPLLEGGLNGMGNFIQKAANGIGNGIAQVTEKISKARQESIDRANEEAARKEKEIRDRRTDQLTKQTNAATTKANLERQRISAESRGDREGLAQINELIQNAANTMTDAKNQIERIDAELDKARKEAEENRKQINEQFDAMMKGGISAGTKFLNNLASGVIPDATAVRKAYIDQKTALMQTQLYINYLSDPARVAKTSLTLFATFYVLKFGYNVVEDWYKVPDLAEKTTLVSPVTKLWRFINDVEVFTTTLDDVVLTPELMTKFKNYVESTKNMIENGGFLRHLLLPGPPGTGKTTLGFAIAGELGIDAIYFNAGKVANASLDISLRRIDQLFKKAEQSEKPILIIIDEAEVLFKHRDRTDMSEATRMIQNSIMARLGTPQNDFILIALTNRVQDFDDAFISRFQNRIIEILAPNEQQRKELIDMYLDKYLVNPVFKPKSGWLDIFFGKEDPIAPDIDADIFTPERNTALARKLTGFTGRDINNLFMDIYAEALATPDAHITKPMVDKVVDEMIINVEKFNAKETAKRPVNAK